MTESSNKPPTDLKIINFAELSSGSAEEQAKLISACVLDGFFYLDLCNLNTSDILQSVDILFPIASEYFDQDLSEKLKFNVDEMGLAETYGYKPMGTHAGVVEGQRDGFEAFKIPSNHLLNLSPLHSVPTFMDKHKGLLAGFVSEAGRLSRMILACLSESLAIPKDNSFEGQHRVDRPSYSSMVMTKYTNPSLGVHQNLGHNAHTDVGSITLLFSSQWGLQVFDQQRNDWAFVPPLAKHAVVNIGDSLRFLSDFRLRSSLHRVVPYATDAKPRYSLAFFLRPETSVKMKTSEGNWCSAQDWHEKKFLNFTKSHEKQRMDSIQTGGVIAEMVWQQ